jgi:hypothetical protein
MWRWAQWIAMCRMAVPGPRSCVVPTDTGGAGCWFIHHYSTIWTRQTLLCLLYRSVFTKSDIVPSTRSTFCFATIFFTKGSILRKSVHLLRFYVPTAVIIFWGMTPYSPVEVVHIYFQLKCNLVSSKPPSSLHVSAVYAIIRCCLSCQNCCTVCHN